MKRTLACLALLAAACGSSQSSTNDGGGMDAAQLTDSGAADGADAEAGPVTPTISSWLGTNVSADLPRVDITFQLNAFNTPANQQDANGYPVAGASGLSQTDIGYILPSGTYNIAYQGNGTLTVTGIGKLGGTWTTANGEQENTLVITGTPGSFGNFLNVQITNETGQTVTAIRILSPSFPFVSPPLFMPQFLNLLKPFRALRFMDWEQTNGQLIANWSDRQTATHFGIKTLGSNPVVPVGEPYEHIAELINETGKDAWITIPEHATAAFITSFAQFMAMNLDFTRIDAARASQGYTTPFQLILEDANETWNGGFTAYATYLAAAQAAAPRYNTAYSGSYGPSWMSGNADLMEVGQYHGDRLVQIGNAFKTAFGAQASVIHPVLSGWSLGPVYQDAGLSFIKTTYGDPKDYVSYLAIAPYFAPSDDSMTGSLSTLFPALTASITAMNATMQLFPPFSTQYGIPMAAYEGGQSLTGTTNQSIKHLAQFDARMHDTYLQYVTFWKTNFGESLFMHFSLCGDPGTPEFIYQYGFWGSIDGVLENTSTCGMNLPMLTGTEDPTTLVGKYCPKYQALAEQVP